jgi:hypothetical protein
MRGSSLLLNAACLAFASSGALADPAAPPEVRPSPQAAQSSAIEHKHEQKNEQVDRLTSDVSTTQKELAATQSQLAATNEQLGATQRELATVAEQSRENAAEFEARAQAQVHKEAERNEQTDALAQAQGTLGNATGFLMGGTADPASLAASAQLLGRSLALAQSSASPDSAAAAAAAQADLARAQEQIAQRNYMDAQVSLTNAALHAAQSRTGVNALPH